MTPEERALVLELLKWRLVDHKDDTIAIGLIMKLEKGNELDVGK